MAVGELLEAYNLTSLGTSAKIPKLGPFLSTAFQKPRVKRDLYGTSLGFVILSTNNPIIDHSGIGHIEIYSGFLGKLI